MGWQPRVSWLRARRVTERWEDGPILSTLWEVGGWTNTPHTVGGGRMDQYSPHCGRWEDGPILPTLWEVGGWTNTPHTVGGGRMGQSSHLPQCGEYWSILPPPPC